ncbi:MAG: metallophosphoesterase [Bacteroidales bacterium]|jgi:hypothetical protein|nr:metallophosphoesterase [Bacteroidales bacterium]MDD2687871.1 metallophosphoesterase [Bacteroidales bacterium]MDD3330457.1 metallophosphoesterase [Bacteroidales bacterium]MDD3690680.1 metallophosphoesterase [Bacteroidales bacterium]MDD4043820.1 metallophosphoesterase [Bacteroidales bacterium]
MKSSSFILFFGVILVLYALAHYYLYVRAIQAFSPQLGVKRWITFIYLLLASSFLAGMFLERMFPSVFHEILYKIGTCWLAFLLYFTLSLLLIDLLRIANHFFHFLPAFSQQQKTIIGFIVIGFVSLLILMGYIHAKQIQIKHIPLSIAKEVEGKKEMRILMASDIHLGAIIGRSWEEKFVRMVANEKPDLVLLCGDLIDGEIAPVIRKQLGKHIQDIASPLGVYAISGNHEYIGNINKSINYLKSIHINVLQDTVLTLSNGLQLVGRKDLQSQYVEKDNEIKSLAELMKNIDHNKPVIVMKHQPYGLDEAVEAQVDLHLSGHTHHGQLFPINLITNALFEVSHGYLKKENTHFYVSSGFGSWGPSVRIGSQAEIVIFDIEFQ